jgi:hypothetical protein
MDDDRKDETQDQFDQKQSQEPGQSGYPEESPGSASPHDAGGAGEADESGSDSRGGPSKPGAAGEGSQSTGNPANAG